MYLSLDDKIRIIKDRELKVDDGGPDELTNPVGAASDALMVSNRSAMSPPVDGDGEQPPDNPIGPLYSKCTIAIGSMGETVLSPQVGEDGKEIPDIPIPTP